MSTLNFTFVTPPRLVVGWGYATDTHLADEVKPLGTRPLIVASNSVRKSGALEQMIAVLTGAGFTVATHEGVPPEPTVAALQDAMDAVTKHDADCVITVGGGSAMDVGKGAAALAGTGHTAQEYHSGKVPVPEVISRPIIAIPTTAGTGSEATWVGVYTDPESTRKASIRGGSMMPSVALLDAELTVSCPPSVTANSGMDAFVQALESYTSKGANAFTDSLSHEATLLAARHLLTAIKEPNNREAREALLLASYMAGAALNTSRLGLVHGIAHPVGAITGAAHGLLCGLLLPPVMLFNRSASSVKYARIARELKLAHEKDSDLDATDALIAHVVYLLMEAEIPLSLSSLGLTEDHLDKVAKESMTSGSTKANPRTVTESDAREVTASCL